MSEYADRDCEEIDKNGGHFAKHMSAMTSEGLDGKFEIAAELGYRDMQIADLTTQLQEVREENICDICGGSGTPTSTKPCACKGTGKMSVAAQTLRDSWVDELARAEAAEQREKELECERDEYVEMEMRFACVLDHATNGMMSKTNYTKEAMYAQIDDAFTANAEEFAKDENSDLREERDAANEANAELGEVLGMVEWKKIKTACGYYTGCPWCHGPENKGHAPDCPRQMAVGDKT